MNLRRSTACSLLLAALLHTTTASAQLTGGLTYYLTDVEVDTPALDYELGLFGATVGYRLASSSLFSLTPELRVGFGVEDDHAQGIKLDVERYYGVNLRAQWELARNTWFFVAPSYTNFQAKASGFGVTAREDDWEFGGGLGLGIGLSENTGLELSYEKFDNLQLIGFGLRGRF